LVRRGLQRKPALWRQLLAICARADRAVKGLEVADPWLLFEDLVLGMAGNRKLICERPQVLG
jgi:DNA polymerase III delta subunit